MTSESKSSFAVVRFNERTYQPGSRGELWPSSRGLRSLKKLWTISIGVRARNSEGQVGVISWRRLICGPEWTPRKSPHFDKCGSIFKRLKRTPVRTFRLEESPGPSPSSGRWTRCSHPCTGPGSQSVVFSFDSSKPIVVLPERCCLWLRCHNPVNKRYRDVSTARRVKSSPLRAGESGPLNGLAVFGRCALILSDRR